MVIDNSAGSEVRPLVLKTVIENGESLVTLVESSDLDLKTLNVNKYSNIINVQELQSAADVYEVSLSETDANLLSIAILNPTVQVLPESYQIPSPWLLNQTFDSGLVKTYRRYLSLLTAPAPELNEAGDIIDVSIGTFAISNDFVFSASGSNNCETVDLSTVETVVEDGVTKIASVSGRTWEGFVVKIAANKLADMAVGDVVCVEFVLRNEGEVSTSKVTGLNLPEQGSDAVSLDYMDSEVAALEATDQAQISYINQRVAELTDRIQNQDSLEAYSAARWTNAKAVCYSTEDVETKVKFLPQFDDALVDFMADSSGNSLPMQGKIFKVNGNYNPEKMSLKEVNLDLAPGIYQIYGAVDAVNSYFPRAAYGHQEDVMSDVNTNPNLLEIRYFENEQAVDSNTYTVFANNIELTSKIFIDPVSHPNWYIGTPGNRNLNSLPSGVTLEIGDRLSSGCVNTIPGLFSWHTRNQMEIGDPSPQPMNLSEFGPESFTGMELIVSDGKAQLSDDAKFGTKSLSLQDPDSLVSVFSTENGEFDFGTKDFCIESWIKFNALPEGLENDTLLRIANHSDSDSILSIDVARSPYWIPSNGLSVIMSARSAQGSMEVFSNDQPGEYLTNDWNHVAVVRRSSRVDIYINGVKVTASQNYIFDEMYPFSNYSNLFISSFNGLVDSLRVTIGDAVYSSSFPVPATPFTADPKLPVISFPDMTKLSVASSSLGITLPNPAVDESEMTAEEIQASRIRKVYTAGVARNVATWQTASGEVYVGPSGDLVEVTPTSGRIIKLGQKINETDLLLDIQDYGFISGVTTKRKKYNFGNLDPASPRALSPTIISFEYGGSSYNGNETFDVSLNVTALDVSSAKIVRLSAELETDITGSIGPFSSIKDSFTFVVNENSTEMFKLVLDNCQDDYNQSKVRYFNVVTGYGLSPDASLSVFQINGQNVYDGGTLIVEPGTTSVTVLATPNHPNASVASITGDTGLVTGNNTVLVEVISEKGTSYIHSVIVNVREMSSDTSLSVLRINGQNVAVGGTASVNYGTTSVTVTATPTDSHASVTSVTGNTGLVTGNNTVQVEVTAENGSTQLYTVTVVVSAPPPYVYLRWTANGVDSENAYTPPYSIQNVTLTKSELSKLEIFGPPEATLVVNGSAKSINQETGFSLLYLNADGNQNHVNVIMPDGSWIVAIKLILV